jgi:hypothetical protein
MEIVHFGPNSCVESLGNREFQNSNPQNMMQFEYVIIYNPVWGGPNFVANLSMI